MSSKRRRREVREFWRWEGISQGAARLGGGTYVQRMPGRGLAVRKEYEPWMVQLTVALSNAAICFNQTADRIHELIDELKK